MSKKPLTEIYFKADATWTCPSNVSKVIIWKSRSEYKICQVKQGVTYVIGASDVPGIFGDFSFNPASPISGFTLTYWESSINT